MDHEATKLRQYLLDDLAAEDRSALDIQLIADPHFVLEVEMAEEDLIDAYLDNELSADEKVKFEEFFILSPERQRHVALSRELKAFGRSDRPEKLPILAPYHTAIAAFFSGNRFRLVFGIGLLVILGTAAIFWAIRPRQNSIQAEYVSINSQDFSDLDQFRTVPTVSLLPGGLRGQTGEKKLISTIGDQVFIRLVLPNEFTARSGFTIKLRESDGADVLEFPNLRSYSNGESKEIRILVPRQLLEKGAYVIDLFPSEAPTLTVTYAFNVE